GELLLALAFALEYELGNPVFIDLPGAPHSAQFDAAVGLARFGGAAGLCRLDLILPFRRQFRLQHPAEIADRDVDHLLGKVHGAFATVDAASHRFRLAHALAHDGPALTFGDDEDHLLQQIFGCRWLAPTLLQHAL